MKDTSLDIDQWDMVLNPNTHWWDLQLRDIWHYRDLLWMFVRRDFVSVYKQTILGQPSVARPTGFPALRFPTRQFRMEPRADLQQRSNAPVDSLTPVRLTLRAACGSLPSGCHAAWVPAPLCPISPRH
jgi:hypothetical protein